MQQAQVGEEVDDLLLAEVAASEPAMGRQAERAQLLLVPLGVGAGREEEDDLARRRLALVDELAQAARDVLRLAAAPVQVGARVGLLVRDEQLDRGPEGRIGEAARRLERLELVPEVAREEVVHDREHLGPRAVVLRQREDAARLRAPLAEDPDVGVAEAVDRLELVPDEEELVHAGLSRLDAREQVDELALEPVRVLELVHHERAEAPLLLARAPASLSRSRSRARSWRSSKSSADSASFAAR